MTEPDNPGVPFPPPIAFLGPLSLALLLEWAAPTDVLDGVARWSVGGLLFLAGLAMMLGGYAAQVHAGTDPLPDHPTTRIVTSGPYRFTRNPMYVGFALITAGVAVLAGSLWALLAVPLGIALIDRLVIVREERYLARKFGEEYEAYRRRVRRWV